jgi:hypothetical protein
MKAAGGDHWREWSVSLAEHAEVVSCHRYAVELCHDVGDGHHEADVLVGSSTNSTTPTPTRSRSTERAIERAGETGE